MPFFRSVFFQVASTSLMKGLSLFILVAVILSDVILVFIALIHCAFSSLSMCLPRWITLSHLRTQIKWLASDTRIWSNCVLPLDLVDILFHWSSFCLWLPVSAMDPIPRIVLIIMLGHVRLPYGHIFWASFHMTFLTSELQSVIMCCIVSTLLQMEHLALSSKLGTSLHLSPVMYML